MGVMWRWGCGWPWQQQCLAVAGKMVAVVAMRLVVGVDGDSGKEGGMGDRWLQLRDYSHCQNSWHFKIIDLR